MKILVTGAAGFIGSFVCRTLIARGDDVVGIDNFNDYYPRNCKEFNLDLISLFSSSKVNHSKEEEVLPIFEKLKEFYPFDAEKVGTFEFYEIDVTEYEKLEELFQREQFDGVIHLAAMAGVPLSAKLPRLYTKVNLDGTVNLLELSKITEVKSFVFASTASAYGQKDHKVTEEDSVSKPWSVYGATKAAGEVMGHAFYKMYGLNFTAVRIFGPVYGPLQRPYGMLIQRAINYVHNDKALQIYGIKGLETAKDFTYIDDEVNGLILALDKASGYELFNVGTSDAIPLKNWFVAIEEAMGKPVKYEIVDVDKGDVATSANISKAKEVLGYAPQMNYKDGVRRQVEIFNLMPDWYKKMDNV